MWGTDFVIASSPAVTLPRLKAVFYRACLLQTKPNSWIILRAKVLGKFQFSEVFIIAKVEAGPGHVRLQEGVGVGGAQEQAEAGEEQQVLPMSLVI